MKNGGRGERRKFIGTNFALHLVRALKSVNFDNSTS
jgi:hypothetical protein